MSYPEDKLWDHINDGWSEMSQSQRHLWDVMKRPPEEWTLRGFGPCWVVAMIGTRVLYFNAYEGGFERSTWTEYGIIDHYGACQ